MNAARPSKPTKIAALLGVVVCAGWNGYRIGEPKITRARDGVATLSTAPAPQEAPASASSTLHNSPLKTPNEEPPFWLSAVVPEPAKPRLPTPARIPGSTGPGIKAAEVASRVSELEAAPSTPENAAR